MKYLVIEKKVESWLNIEASGAKIAADKTIEAWIEAYKELAILCQYRFASSMKKEEIAHGADVLASGLLFSAKLAGFKLPDDFDDNELRRETWGSDIELRISEIEENRAKFSDWSDEEILNLLKETRSEMSAQARRSHMHLAE
jgi:hypothetical protein